VDEGAPVAELGLEGEAGTVAVAGPAGVVGATIAAHGVGPANVQVLVNQLAVEGNGLGVNVVGDNANGGLATIVGDHVELHHAADGDAAGLVAVGNSLGAQETDLLGGVPVELNGVLGAEASGGEDAKDLKDANGARGIIISTGGASRGHASSSAVLVGAKNDNILHRARGALNPGDQGRLEPGVGELGDRDIRPVGGDGEDLVVEPVGRVKTGLGGVVPVAEGSHGGQLGLVQVGINEGEQGVHHRLVERAGGDGSRGLGGQRRINFLEVSDVHVAQVSGAQCLSGLWGDPEGRERVRGRQKTVALGRGNIAHGGRERNGGAQGNNKKNRQKAGHEGLERREKEKNKKKEEESVTSQSHICGFFHLSFILIHSLIYSFLIKR